LAVRPSALADLIATSLWIVITGLAPVIHAFF